MIAKWRATRSLSLEREGKITIVEEKHYVERVTAILKNPHHSEIYRRNIRDKLRVELTVRTVAAKAMMPAMAKLVREIAELMSDVIDYGLVSHPMMCSTSSCGEQCILPFSGQLTAGCKLMTQTVVAKDAVSMMKLATETEESTSSTLD